MNHTPFIVAAYVVAFLGLGGLLAASLLARRQARRELGLRGLERR